MIRIIKILCVYVYVLKVWCVMNIFFFYLI